MSMIVERPRKKAKPFTFPTATRYRTIAASSDTKSAAHTVRHALLKPRSTEVRTERPDLVSSLRRSK